MAQRKSTPVIIIGVAVFVVGAALAFLLLRNNNDKKSTKKVAIPAAITTTTLPGSFTPPPASSGTPAVPAFQLAPGTAGVALQMAFFPGGGGFVRPGSTVDIYAVVKAHPGQPAQGSIAPSPASPPFVKLILPKVKVLEAIGQPPGQAGQPTAFLLQLDPGQAEEAIFYQTFESLYFTVVPDNSTPASTPGHSYANGL